MSKEKIAELQKALAAGQKSFDFGSSVQLAAATATRKGYGTIAAVKK